MAYITFETELWFGKHEGETGEQIAENDPSYIIWLDESTDHEVDPELLELAEDNDFFDEDYRNEWSS